MKSRMCRVWVFGLGLLILPLASGCLPQSSSSGETVAAAAEPEKAPESAPTSINEDVVAQTPLVDDEVPAEISNAPATPVSDDITVPANLRPTPAVSELIKLANSGVGDSVMLTFVTNSVSTFNLRPEEIIYLTDIGVPANVVTAMLQHDHLLQAKEPYISDLSAVPPATPAIANQPAVPDQSVVANQYAPQPLPTAPEQSVALENAPPYSPIGYTVPEVPQVVAAPAEPESGPDFYDSMAPYGTWVDVAGYGWCWQPTAVVVNPAWQPYCDHGHWAYSSCGWYWMSDYSWGWAPFHYGRWLQHQHLGWCWVPDHVWGPSWVCWRYSQSYCGWAALPPSAGFTAGVGLTFHGHKAGSDSSFGLAANQFHFVSTDHFTDRHVNRHVVSRDQARKIFDNTVASTTTTLRNDTVVISGIPKDRVAAISHQPVPQVALHANPGTLPLSSGQPFSDKVLRRPASGLNAAIAQRAQEDAPLSADRASASLSHHQPLPQKPLAASSFGSRTTSLPHNGRDTGLHSSSEKPNSEVTTVVSQPQPGKAGPLILRGPSRPPQERPATLPRPAKEPGNSTLVVIGSRHPAPAAGFTHNTPQPVHLPSAQTQSQPTGTPSDKSSDDDSPARFHQALRTGSAANAAPSVPQQVVPWWTSRPQPAPAGAEINRSPAQPSAPAYVNHPAPQASHHDSSPAASAPAASHSQSQSRTAPSAPAASHSQSSSSKSGR